MRLIGWEVTRDSTSRNQAKGSAPDRWQEATKVRETAAVLPPWSLPKEGPMRRQSGKTAYGNLRMADEADFQSGTGDRIMPGRGLAFESSLNS